MCGYGNKASIDPQSEMQVEKLESAAYSCTALADDDAVKHRTLLLLRHPPD